MSDYFDRVEQGMREAVRAEPTCRGTRVCVRDRRVLWR